MNEKLDGTIVKSTTNKQGREKSQDVECLDDAMINMIHMMMETTPGVNN